MTRADTRLDRAVDEVLDLYKVAVIDQVEAVTRIYRLGFLAIDANAIVDLCDQRVKYEVRG